MGANYFGEVTKCLTINSNFIGLNPGTKGFKFLLQLLRF